jgi:hypothetical protein
MDAVSIFLESATVLYNLYPIAITTSQMRRISSDLCKITLAYP